MTVKSIALIGANAIMTGFAFASVVVAVILISTKMH
jgi:hypothetical protein